jgi:hypothetical protein
MQSKKFVLRWKSNTWQYLCMNRGKTEWRGLACVMRAETAKQPLRALLFDTEADVEAYAAGLVLSGLEGDFDAVRAFGVLVRWGHGSTGTANTSRSKRTRLPLKRRSG